MMILDQLGRRDEAMAERLTTLRGLSVAQGLAEHVEALARNKGWREAMDVWIALLERTNRWEGAAMQWMAVGEPSRALDALEHCVKARTTYLCFTAQNPYFRPLHNEPALPADLADPQVRRTHPRTVVWKALIRRGASRSPRPQFAGRACPVDLNSCCRIAISHCEGLRA